MQGRLATSPQGLFQSPEPSQPPEVGDLDLLGILLFLFPLLGLTELFWILGILLCGEGAALMILSFRIPSES